MTADNPQPSPIARANSRRQLIALLLLGWTVLCVAAIWWLGNGDHSVNTVIHLGQGETKSLGARLAESFAMARLNFPWAMAWIFLAPYVLWIGVRFTFESGRWRSRSLVLLATGIAFVWASQWLSRRLGAGEATVIMVKYTADSSVQRVRGPAGKTEEPESPDSVTNHLVTNRFTRIMVTSDSARVTNLSNLEVATSEILSGLATNLPHSLAGGVIADLPSPGPIHPRRWSAALDGLAYISLLGLAHAGVFYRRFREREQQAALLESRLNQARLRALQAQLQPHFLFNTLNGIATLLRRDPATAEEMLLSLSDLLRIALSSSDKQEIPLREEMEFLGRYFAIQQMRFGERLRVTEAIEPDAMDCLVPALLLQPLVENAIRHGIEPSGRAGELRIAGSRDGDWLKLTVEDDGVGLPANTQSRAGVGLANVRERLAALHGNAHEFNIAEKPQGGVVVSIKLPARTELVTAAETESAPPHPALSPAGGEGGRRPGEGVVHGEQNLT